MLSCKCWPVFFDVYLRRCFCVSLHLCLMNQTDYLVYAMSSLSKTITLLLFCIVSSDSISRLMHHSTKAWGKVLDPSGSSGVSTYLHTNFISPCTRRIQRRIIITRHKPYTKVPIHTQPLIPISLHPIPYLTQTDPIRSVS